MVLDWFPDLHCSDKHKLQEDNKPWIHIVFFNPDFIGDGFIKIGRASCRERV